MSQVLSVCSDAIRSYTINYQFAQMRCPSSHCQQFQTYQLLPWLGSWFSVGAGWASNLKGLQSLPPWPPFSYNSSGPETAHGYTMSFGSSMYAPPLGVQRYTEARSHNQCCHAKAISITYSECLSVALVIQHAMRMRRIILSVASPPAPFFPPHLINGTTFISTSLNTKCVFWFSLQILSETFLFLRRTRRDRIINVYRYSCQVPVILVRFYSNS